MTTPVARVLSSDVPNTEVGVATFTAPAGWSIAGDETHALLTGPEDDLKISIVNSGATAEGAIAAAWKSLRADFNRELDMTQSQPAGEGWDELRAYYYKSSPNEHTVAFANAMRHGSSWVAVAIESGRASFEKRVSGVMLAVQTLRPKGFTKESFAGKKSAKLDASRIERIVAFVEQARDALGVPGVAVGIVQDGKVILQRGFGVRELGKEAKVEPTTLFMIGSNTKALTTLLLAQEVDEKKFRWDTPVTQVYPGFKLGNAETTSLVQMKHLICACTGVPRADFEWLFGYSRSTPKTVFVSLSTMQPTTKFGETFQYSNLMAGGAGYVAGYVAYPKLELGAAYDKAMSTKIFDPLAMKSTTFDMEKALAGDHAAPHSRDAYGKQQAADIGLNRSIVPVRPAGAAWSNVPDMLKYIEMELRSGALPDGRQLVSKSSLLARREPQIKIGETLTYGMGLMVNTEWGTPVVSHGGATFGYHSNMFWFPEHNVGAVILTNSGEGFPIPHWFVRMVAEQLFDGKPEALDGVLSAAKTYSTMSEKWRARLTIPAAPDQMAQLGKRYKSELLGELALRQRGKTSVFAFDGWESSIATIKNDDGTTSIVTIDPGVTGFEFVVGSDKAKKTLTLRDSQHEYVFTEMP